MLVLCSVTASAQTSASLTGIVRDESGAVIAHVDLTLADAATGVQRRAVSDDEGIYIFAGLPPGTYVLLAGGGRFATVRIEGITLADGDRRSLPVVLQVAPLAEAVSVTATSVVAGRVPTRILDTPQTVSVLTQEQLEAQNLTTLQDALEQTTGMTVVSADSARSLVYSRGFPVDAIQRDGLPIRTNVNFAMAPDLVLYERVEVLRGPAGLFHGAGEPGGAVNLVRKRPRADFGASGEVIAGSWDAYRASVDVTGPLSAGGRVRGRAVAAYEDRDFFTDVATQSKPTLYGTVDVDLAASTTLSVAGTRQQIDSTPFFGLPAFATGAQIDVQRSTFLGADWNRYEMHTTDVLVDLEHRFAGGPLAKFSARYVDQSADAKFAFPNQAVNPATLTARLGRQRFAGNQQDVTIDGHVLAPFRLFDQMHGVLAGVDHRRSNGESRVGAASALFQDVTAPDVRLPDDDIAFTTRSETEQTQTGAYGQARIRAASMATVVVGGRVTQWENTSRNLMTGTSSAYAVDATFTSYAGVVADLRAGLAAYASYTETFQPQDAIDAAGELLPPRIGYQYEAGLKVESSRRPFQAHAAVFEIQDRNRALPDVDNPLASIAAGKVRSRGFEAEINGTPRSGWNVFAGYAFTTTTYLTAPEGQQGQTFNTFTPRHSFNLWSRYTVQSGPLRGLSFGASLKTLTEFYTQAAPTIRFVEDGYTVINAQVGYWITPRLLMTVTVANLLDEVYYKRVSSASSGNRYGEPRGVALAMRVTF